MREMRTALLMLVFLTVLTGVIYPLGMTALAGLLFPYQAGGSLLVEDGRVVGSERIGQAFHDPKYFWGRPSATAPFPYNAAASSGSNYGPLNADLKKAIEARRQVLHAADPGNDQPIPLDLLTASASGLDPHISPEAARYQLGRVARARGLAPARVARLVAEHTQPRQLGFLGEPVVNVLELNRAVDRLERARP